MLQLYWIRNDFRLEDNTALYHAMNQGPTIALYIASPSQWVKHNDSNTKIDFWRRNLDIFRSALNDKGVPSLLKVTSDWEEIPKLLNDLCKRLNIQSVHANEEYGENETQRDQKCQRILKSAGVDFQFHFDQLLFKPGSICTKEDQYFKVFSAFKRVCHQRLLNQLVLTRPQPQNQQNIVIPEKDDAFEWPKSHLSELWPAGEAHAQNLLNDFAHEKIADYKINRNIPSLLGTSQLSPYLTSGVISIRQCYAKTSVYRELDGGLSSTGIMTWIDELLWREFYKHILVGFPHVAKGKPWNSQYDHFPWVENPEALSAWESGSTGIPIVDAGMRQMIETGWMHNRVRMICAMFLCKNLLIDWRKGEQFFMRHLVDGDLAANNGGWQWCASTGVDSAPYFRVFNPITQSERFDPEGTYLRRWIPELSDQHIKKIHQPDRTDLLSQSCYPKPIVDLSLSRKHCIDVFKTYAKTKHLNLEINR